MHSKYFSQVQHNNHVFSVLSALIYEYSHLSVKNHLFGNNLNIQVILGIPLEQIQQYVGIQISRLQKNMIKSNNRKQLRKYQPLFSLISIQHPYYIQYTNLHLQKSIQKIEQELWIILSDGTVVTNILNNIKTDETNCVKKVKAILIRTYFKQQIKSNNNNSQLMEQHYKQITKQHKNYFLRLQEIYKKQQIQQIQQKYQNQQKITQNITHISNLQQLYTQIEQYLVIVELFHSHVNLNMCVYTYQQHTNTLFNQISSNQQQNIYNNIANQQLGIDRADIPNSAQFYTLKQRGSKITQQQLRQLEQQKLSEYYNDDKQLENKLVLKNIINYEKQQKQFLQKLRYQNIKLGQIYKISYGMDALFIWITYRGFPILQILPTIKNSHRNMKECPKTSKSLKKIKKVLTQQQHRFGYNKYVPKINIPNNNNEELSNIQEFDDSQSQYQYIKNDIQKLSIYIIELVQQPCSQDSPYYHTFQKSIRNILINICQFFIQAYLRKQKQAKQIQKIKQLQRISYILVNGTNGTHQQKQRISSILMDKFYHDSL